MKYSVWAHNVLLGETDLAMPSPNPNGRMGHLEIAADFARAWAEVGPAVDELIAAGAAVGNSVADIPPPATGALPSERGRQVFDWLSAHPGAARLRAAGEAVASLGLELRDASGRRIDAISVLVQEVRPPAWIPSAEIEQRVEEARAEGLALAFPMYIVVVVNPNDVVDQPQA